MTGSAGLCAAAANPSDRLRDRDGWVAGGGFDLTLAEVQGAADEFDRLVEAERHRDRTEHARARDACSTEIPPLPLGMTTVQRWLADAERDWCTQHRQVLTNLAGAGCALRDTAAHYWHTDMQLAADLAALAEDHASARPANGTGTGTGIRDSVIDAPAGAALGDPSPHRFDGPAWAPRVLAERIVGDAGPTSLSEAVALWQARKSDAAQLAALLTATAVAVPSWRGDAAQAYQHWLASLIDSCHCLRDHAEHVHRQLAQPGTSSDMSGSNATSPAPAPPAVPATSSQPTTLPAAQPAGQPAPAMHTPDTLHGDPQASASSSTPFLPEDMPQHRGPLATSMSQHEPACPPDMTSQPPDDEPATSQPCHVPPRPDPCATDDQHDTDKDRHDQDRHDTDRNDTGSNGTGSNGTSKNEAGEDSARMGRDSNGSHGDGSPGTAPDPPDTDPGTTRPGPTTQPPSLDREDPAPAPPIPKPTPSLPTPTLPTPTPTPTPTPAPALPAPLPSPGEPPATGPSGPPAAPVGPVPPTSSRSDSTALLVGVGATAAAAATAAVLLARRDRDRTPRSPDVADTAPIPRIEQAPDALSHRPYGPGRPPFAIEAAAPRGDHRPEPFPGAAGDAGSPNAETASAAFAVGGARPWLPIGVLDHQPVLIDLAATRGLGLTGPGAPAVARALLSALLDLEPDTAVVIAANTAHELFGPPGDNSITPPPRTNAPPGDIPPRPDENGHDEDEHGGNERWPARVRVTPDPFTALEVVEAELIRRRVTSGPPDGWPLWLLLAPAPTTTPAQHRLAATLTAGQPLGIGAILTGWWPTGWNCHLDDHHRITQHTDPDHDTPTAPVHLVGAQLNASTPAQLREALAPTAHTPTHAENLWPERGEPPPPDPNESAATSDTGSDPRNDGDGAARPGNPTGGGDGAQHDKPQPDGPPRAKPPVEHHTPQPAHPAPRPSRPRGAASATAATAGPTHPPLRLSILGPTVLRYTPPGTGPRSPTARDAPGGPGAVIDRLGPRATELLVYLAVHPSGVHRDHLVAALWPDADRSRPTNALNATLARLRKTLRATGNPNLAHVITHIGDRYLLDSNLIDVDYWTFLIAAADITHPDPTHRTQACDTAIRTYQGHLAADLTSEWLITLREATRRRYFDALTTLARLTIHDDPERTLALLETARNLDPLKEGIYRDIMRIQAQLNRPDAAENTLTLLRAQLADIDTEPDPETLQLAATIRHQANRPSAPDTTTPTT
ncbi:BTAD domain-containing putative transcriptional regulator [Pseudonocardia adelaidensis]|uniref:DNA-binding SARP family transcriptional activator n=1 Tax=Pseudonocardia adelaidensis TaxID=648754 RepID=A0ABP9NH01_9PSEU